MAKLSVDDMYHGCYDEAKNSMQDRLNNELNIDPFATAWKNIEKDMKDIMTLYPTLNKKEPLPENEFKAICLYTAPATVPAAGAAATEMKFHDTFNDAVQRGESKYGSTEFQFHFLYFMLTSAIQSINRKHGCYTTYRRTKHKHTGVVNDIIRLNYFASSSLAKNKDNFGSETCFEIKTCSGAYLEGYSCSPGEKEVLIPPYEMFKITNTFSKSQIKDEELKKNCNQLITLVSVGVHSNLNCKISKEHKQT